MTIEALASAALNQQNVLTLLVVLGLAKIWPWLDKILTALVELVQSCNVMVQKIPVINEKIYREMKSLRTKVDSFSCNAEACQYFTLLNEEVSDGNDD